MCKRSDSGGSPQRWPPLGLVSLAVATAASLVLGVVAAVGAFDGGTSPETRDPRVAGHGQQESGLNANRQELGRGDSAFGPYVMYASTGPEGTCVEIELPEKTPHGERAFYSDCSRDSDSPVNSAEVGDGTRTLVFGLVPEDTASVEIDRETGRDLAGTLRRGHRGEGMKFFVASTPEASIEARIRAIGADGRQIAAEWLPRAEFTDPCFGPQSPRAVWRCTRPAPK